MKKSIVGACVLMTTFGGNPTLAGSLSPAIEDPMAVAPAAAPMMPAAGRDWTGGYVGGSLAYFTGKAVYCDSSTGDPYDCDDPADGLPEPSPQGAMAGITAGYDWQRGNYVYGVAGDLMFGDLSDSVGDSDNPDYGCGNGCGLEVDSIAIVRGRVGLISGDFLPYVTAGIANTQATVTDNATASDDGTYTSFVIGAGAEYMVSDTLSAGFDVLHLLEGDETIFSDDFCTDCGATQFSATIARLTLAYRF